MDGASEKRTDLGELIVGLSVPRRDFFRKEEEDVTRGRSEARVKSLEREGSLGCDIVEAVVSVGVPRNWETRSLYCICSLCSVSCIVRDAEVSPASSNRIRSLVTFSHPSRNDSSDLDIWPS